MSFTRANKELARWIEQAGMSQQTLADILSARVGRRVSQGMVSRAVHLSAPRGDIQSALWAIARIRPEWWSEPVSDPEPAGAKVSCSEASKEVA